jgi:hypothetical protein
MMEDLNDPAGNCTVVATGVVTIQVRKPLEPTLIVITVDRCPGAGFTQCLAQATAHLYVHNRPCHVRELESALCCSRQQAAVFCRHSMFGYKRLHGCGCCHAGVDVSPENLAAGLKFSWPTYKSGLRIMIHAHLQTGSTWAFSEIFRWEVWELCVCLSMCRWFHQGLHAGARGEGWQPVQ